MKRSFTDRLNRLPGKLPVAVLVTYSVRWPTWRKKLAVWLLPLEIIAATVLHVTADVIEQFAALPEHIRDTYRAVRYDLRSELDEVWGEIFPAQ